MVFSLSPLKRDTNVSFRKILNLEEAPEGFDFESAGILADTGCPFCRLFITEVGIMNGSEKDLAIFSLHMRKAHGYFFGGK